MNQNPLQEIWELILNIGGNPYEENWQKIPHSIFGKYCGFSLYDTGLIKSDTIEHEEIHFIHKYWYDLIVNPDHPYGTSIDQKYFFIHDDLFNSF